jgi:DNA-binding transcriptional LysR family regulator
VSFSELNLLPILPGFFRQFPEITVDLILRDEPLDLIDHRIDLALQLGPISLPSSYRVSPLAKMVSRVVATPKYLSQAAELTDPEDLVQHACLLLDMPGFGDQWFYRQDDRSLSRSVQVSGPLRTSNAIALKAMTLQHVGLSLQADWIVGKELATGELVDVFPKLDWSASLFDNTMFVILPPGSHIPRRTNSFVEYLRQAFKYGPVWSGYDKRP